MMYNTAINPKELFKEAIRTIYPRKCPGCRDVLLPNMLVCDDCAGRFKPVEPPFCMKCGRHVEDDETELCDDCMAKDHRFSYMTGSCGRRWRILSMPQLPRMSIISLISRRKHAAKG